MDEGDVTGVVCPEPNCRVPISEEILCLLFGSGSQAPRLRLHCHSQKLCRKAENLDLPEEQTRLEQLKTLKFARHPSKRKSSAAE